MPFLDDLGLLSRSQRSGMMFIIVSQSLVNLCSLTGISRVWFVDGEREVLFSTSLQGGDSKPSLPLGALMVISPILTLLTLAHPWVFKNRINPVPGAALITQGLVGGSSTCPGRVRTRFCCCQSLKHHLKWDLENFAINILLASPHYTHFELFLFILNGKSSSASPSNITLNGTKRFYHQSFIVFSSLHSLRAFPFHPKWQTNAWELSSAGVQGPGRARRWIPRVHFPVPEPCLPGLAPALVELSQSQGEFWDVHWASPWLLGWKIPGPACLWGCCL